MNEILVLSTKFQYNYSTITIYLEILSTYHVKDMNETDIIDEVYVRLRGYTLACVM